MPAAAGSSATSRGTASAKYPADAAWIKERYLEVLPELADPVRADHRGGARREGRVDVGVALVARDEPSKPVRPCEAALDRIPGAVVTLMERSIVEMVMVAGHIRKWKEHLLDHDFDRLRGQLDRDHDRPFDAAIVERDRFV